MLDDLPAEVLQQIVSHLPSASSIVNLSFVNHKLHNQISAKDFAVFRQFVQRSFPSIETPPAWRDSAIALTSRSRAWDRRAFVARECRPPPDDTFSSSRAHAPQKVSFVPAIDSYETWPGNSVPNRREVLAWGAAGRLRLRVATNGSFAWKSFKFPDDHLAENDILDLRLLRPRQKHSLDEEAIFLRRANGIVEKIEVQADHNSFVQTNYVSNSEYLDCMDISRDVEPLLALCNPQSIRLFPAHSHADQIEAIETLLLEQSLAHRHRNRCVKFLSGHKLAVAVQFVEGKDPAPINIYDINSTRLPSGHVSPVTSFAPSSHLVTGRHGAATIANLENVFGNSGQLYLSGWTDGVVRLHDTRTSRDSVTEYVDGVDDGQILSLLAIGREKFLAGSHQNACLKTFDMRMPGGSAYSWLNASPVNEKTTQPGPVKALAMNSRHTVTEVQRDINIFLALVMSHSGHLWQPLPNQRNNRLPRYRGSVYSLSAPSAMSPTVYAGIESHVIQLDFVSTDDIHRGITSMVDPILGLEHEIPERILNLSCYERPRAGHESTDAALLRKQRPWAETCLPRMQNDRYHGTNPLPEPGWDDRWYLASNDRGRWRDLHPEQRRRRGGW